MKKTPIQATPRAHPGVMGSLPSIFKFVSDLNYAARFPPRSAAERMADAWEKTGRQMQTAIIRFSGKATPSPRDENGPAVNARRSDNR